MARARPSVRMMPLLLMLLALAVTVAPVVEATDASGRCHRKPGILASLRQLCMCEPCDQCHYNVWKLQCEPIQPQVVVHVTDTHGHREMALVQPQLDPSSWFLTEDEVTAARGGVPRQDLQLCSERNDLVTFSATDEFFASAYSDLDDLARNATTDWDGVYLTGWSLDDVPFLPQATNWMQTTLREVLGRLMRHGVVVSALVWANVLERSQNVELQKWMNDLSSRLDTYAGLLLFDDRLPYPTSSQHQKTLVLSHSGSSDRHSIAYVGGIDLTHDRWDTKFHNVSKLRDQQSIRYSYDGWVDASSRIQGPAAHDVAVNFAARWNSKHNVLVSQEALLSFKNPPTNSSTNVTVAELPKHNGSGTAAIQIVRTFSCKVEYEFAPKGEISLFKARLKAIRQAQNFIYVEDQYFILVPELQAALLDRLPYIQQLVVVAQKPSTTLAAVGYGKLLHDMLHPLVTQFPDKVAVYMPKKGLDVYVHSKVLLVDDVFLSIGSGNWNRRSMSSDSELAANIVDRATRRSSDGLNVSVAAHDFRIRKFSEFTELSDAAIRSMTFAAAVDELDRAADDRNSLIEHLVTKEEAYFSVFPDGFQDVIDPFDRC